MKTYLQSSFTLFILVTLHGCAGIGATPKATLGEMPSDGPVGRTMKAHSDEFIICGQDSIAVQTGTEQKLSLKFTVEKDGSVKNPRVENIKGPDPDLNICLMRTLRKIRFPEPHDGKSKEVTYPLVLKPE